MYYMQSRGADGLWEREDDSEYHTVLSALEARDQLIADHRAMNNGTFWHDWRVVDDDGTIYEYGHATV